MSALQLPGARPVAPPQLSSRFSLAARPLPCAGAGRADASRARCVEVFADKGKRRGRAMNNFRPMQQPQPVLPPVDPENVQFVIFFRSKNGLKRWAPLNVVTGGAQANLLAKGLEADLTKESSRSTLVREFAKTVYKDRVKIEEMIRKNFPGMRFAKEIEYGMSLLDKERVLASVQGTGNEIWLLPPEDSIEKTAVEAAAEGAAGVVNTLSEGWKNLVDGLSIKSPA